MVHLHITAWVLALILFFVARAFYKQGNKAGKILHMILRLDYIIILYSGGSLFADYLGTNFMPEVIVKSLAGLWVIASLEMILVKMTKDKSVKSFWIQLAISLILVLVLGFGRLPGGLLPNIG